MKTKETTRNLTKEQQLRLVRNIKAYYKRIGKLDGWDEFTTFMDDPEKASIINAIASL